MRELKRRYESVSDYIDREKRIDKVRLKDRANQIIQSLEEIDDSCDKALRLAKRVKDLADLENTREIENTIIAIERRFWDILEEAKRNLNF